MAFKMTGPSLLKMVKQMKEGTPMKKDVPTERQDNMRAERAANEAGSKLPAADPMRKNLFDKADKLSAERTRRSRAGAPMKKREDGGKTYTAMARGENKGTGDLEYVGGSFDQAFADARKSGARTFTYSGKKYTTKMKGEKDIVKIPKKKIKPLPVKTDVKLKGPEDRPDPTFEGTDEFRSLDEIRRDSEKNR